MFQRFPDGSRIFQIFPWPELSGTFWMRLCTLIGQLKDQVMWIDQSQESNLSEWMYKRWRYHMNHHNSHHVTLLVCPITRFWGWWLCLYLWLLCKGESYMVQQALSAYRRWGLELKEGDIVNIPLVHEATAIMLCWLEEIRKPNKLEALCAHTVDNQMTDYSNDLPLPKPIIECFEDGHYYYQVGGSFFYGWWVQWSS